MRRLTTLVGIATAWLVVAAPASAAPPAPFGHPCTPQNGVRFCPTPSDPQRVPSFDDDPGAGENRVPLDVDVTLPPTGDGPFPTIVMLHGYGNNKGDFESDREEGRSSTTFHYNNNFYAKRGYAVVNYSARGFGRSCGSPDSRSNTPPQASCARGYIHLADQRYEAHDTQHLLGLLVDQGIANPDALGVTGISYGGGQSIELAILRDQIRNVDRTFSPWTAPDDSPGGPAAGTRLSISAAYPRWPWSDLVYSLLPNGRYRDDQQPDQRYSRDPIGIPILSFINGLYASGKARGFYCGDGSVPPVACIDPSADINRWYARFTAGEPYEGESEAEAIADEIFNFHQGFGLREQMGSSPPTPAPLLLQSGWTDDLFPVAESLRIYNQVRDLQTNGSVGNESADVALQFGDLGHMRGSNKENADRDFNDEGADFFDAKLRRGGAAPAAGSVKAYTQTCPAGAAAGGPFTASSWPLLHPDSIAFGSSEGDAAQPVTPSNPANSPLFDPIAAGNDPCRRVADEDDPGTAVYRGSPVPSGFTMLGRPSLTLNIAATALEGQLDARLFDVAPDGQQTLVSRGGYRLTSLQSGPATLQLNGNGYCFEAGHRPKLQLQGQDAPYLRPTNGPSAGVATDVRSARISLPGRTGACQSRFESGSAGSDGGDSNDGGDDSSNNSGGPDPAAAPAPLVRGGLRAGPCANERRGTSRANRLRGTQMGDRLLGLGGRDTLWGLGGSDCLVGGSGTDRLSGGPGNDVLSGGSGADRLRGGPGSDRISGGSGNDVIDVRGGGRDRVSCGSGRDRVRLGRGDRARGC